MCRLLVMYVMNVHVRANMDDEVICKTYTSQIRNTNLSVYFDNPLSLMDNVISRMYTSQNVKHRIYVYF